jgi:putative ABC transport system substrate-binding protein
VSVWDAQKRRRPLTEALERPHRRLSDAWGVAMARSFDRRQFGVAVVMVALQGRYAGAQSRVPRVGILSLAGNGMEDAPPSLRALLEGLREAGLEPGRDIELDIRFGGGDARRLPDLARELVANRPAVLVAGGNPAIIAVRPAVEGSGIPVVMAAGALDPVRAGLAASLDRPGGAFTGAMAFIPDAAAQRVALLRDLVPGLVRLAVLSNPDNPAAAPPAAEATAAARAAGADPTPLALRPPGNDADAVFAAAKAAGIQAVLAVPGPDVWMMRRAIAEAALRHSLPAVLADEGYAEAGGLATLYPPIVALWRASARHVAAILRGALPGELAITLPERMVLVVNADTARRLGLELSPAIRARADRVVGT